MIYDFIRKLQQNPKELEVLGDGTQTKSYLHIDDCVNAFSLTVQDEFWQSPVEAYNIGSEDQTNVRTIASIVSEAMGLSNVPIRTRPGRDGRAWPGDVKTMLLDISKIKKKGWAPRYRSTEAIRLAATELSQELGAK